MKLKVGVWNYTHLEGDHFILCRNALIAQIIIIIKAKCRGRIELKLKNKKICGVSCLEAVRKKNSENCSELYDCM